MLHFILACMFAMFLFGALFVIVGTIAADQPNEPGDGHRADCPCGKGGR